MRQNQLVGGDNCPFSSGTETGQRAMSLFMLYSVTPAQKQRVPNGPIGKKQGRTLGGHVRGVPKCIRSEQAHRTLSGEKRKRAVPLIVPSSGAKQKEAHARLAILNDL